MIDIFLPQPLEFKGILVCYVFIYMLDDRVLFFGSRQILIHQEL